VDALVEWRALWKLRTDGDRLDLDSLFKVRRRRIVGIFMLKNLLAAESVYESGPT